MFKRAICLVVICLAFSENTKLYKFKRWIEETGAYFYKMKMSLGTCAETELFKESKVWANERMNRIFDIYYKSDNPYYLVSKVEITLVINNTDVYARSERGVGYLDFSGFVVLPTRSGVIIYTLKIYTCFNNGSIIDVKENVYDTNIMAPFHNFEYSSYNEYYNDESDERSEILK